MWKKCYQSNNFIKHKQEDHYKLNFNCYKCDQYFKTKNELKIHLYYKHSKGFNKSSNSSIVTSNANSVTIAVKLYKNWWNIAVNITKFRNHSYSYKKMSKLSIWKKIKIKKSKQISKYKILKKILKKLKSNKKKYNKL